MNDTTQKQVLTPAIAAAYWGAKVQRKRLEPHYGDKDIVCGQWLYMCYSTISEYQLKLTPLSEISDIDMKFVIDTLNHRGEYSEEDLPPLSEHRGALIRVFGDIESEVAQNDVSPVAIMRCYDYLRASEWNGKPKQAYDCGYGSIPSLIQAGIAVSSVKTEK